MWWSRISWRRCVGDHVDQLLTVQDARDVDVIEDPLAAGQAERGAGDDDRLRWSGLALAQQRPTTLDHAGEQLSELAVGLIGE